MLSALGPFRYRNFALIWFSAFLSNIGSWMQTVAVGVMVTATTGQAGWTGLVAAAGFIPSGLFSPIGGVMADRMDRRHWVFITTVGETTAALALTTLTLSGSATPGLVTLLVFAGGCMSAVGFPAYQSMLPEMVPADELASAIGLSSAQYNLGRVIGPVLAGLVIAFGGYGAAFAVNTGSFAAVMVALCLVRIPRFVPPETSERVMERLRAGARATWANPAARFSVVAISVVALTASPFIALVAAMAIKVFNSGSTGTSVLITAQGIGAVLGALALTPVAGRIGRRRLLIVDLLAVCVFLVLYAAAPDLWLGAVALSLVGAGYIGVLAGLNTIIQLTAPDLLRGRMLGIYMMALGLLYPVGALVQGWIADTVNLRLVTAGVAVLLGLVVVLTYRWIPAFPQVPVPMAVRTDPGEPAPGEATPDQAALEQAGLEQAGLEQASVDQAVVEQAVVEQAAAEQAAGQPNLGSPYR